MSCIVLAAGASKRLGRPKQLVDFDGQVLIVHAAQTAVRAAPTIVVIPPNAPAIRDVLLGLDVKIVENDLAGEGMASSIRAGVAATEGDVLITLCDQPKVTSEHLRALIDAHAPIAATGYRGIAGVPAFFAAQYRGELLALRGDVGARSVIEVHADAVVTIPFEAAGFDVDTGAAFSL